eukprot:1150661-Pelagomonas_calceolata.AAC.2
MCKNWDVLVSMRAVPASQCSDTPHPEYSAVSIQCPAILFLNGRSGKVPRSLLAGLPVSGLRASLCCTTDSVNTVWERLETSFCRVAAVARKRPASLTMAITSEGSVTCVGGDASVNEWFRPEGSACVHQARLMMQGVIV